MRKSSVGSKRKYVEDTDHGVVCQRRCGFGLTAVRGINIYLLANYGELSGQRV
jgi:hypothetical protein